VQVVLPSWYSAGCAADPSCKGTNLLLLSNYYAPEGGMVRVISGVVAQGANLLPSDRSITTQVVSGKQLAIWMMLCCVVSGVVAQGANLLPRDRRIRTQYQVSFESILSRLFHILSVTTRVRSKFAC
jgi:hypothetical protein